MVSSSARWGQEFRAGTAPTGRHKESGLGPTLPPEVGRPSSSGHMATMGGAEVFDVPAADNASRLSAPSSSSSPRRPRSALSDSEGGGAETYTEEGAPSEEAATIDPKLLAAATRKRRNTLCDRLLEALFSSTKAHDKERRLLLIGRSSTEEGGRFTTSFEQAMAVFHHTSHNGALTPGPNIAEAFLLLDYPYPGADLLEKLIKQICNGRSGIDAEDFVRILSAYEGGLKTLLYTTYTEHLPRAMTQVHYNLLPRVFMQAGVIPMPGVTDELYEELLEEKGEGTVRVDIKTFERFYEDVVSRAGLTKLEHERLGSMFEAVEDDRGLVSEQELIKLLYWHDSVNQLVGGEEFIQKLADETIRRTQQGRVDFDIRGWMESLAETPRSNSPSQRQGCRQERKANGSAFLMAARILHEKLLRTVQGTMLELKMNIGQGKVVRVDQLVPLAEELGFVNVIPSIVHQVLQDCKLDGFTMLSFDQVYTFVFRFVCTPGLTEDDTAELARAFRRFDADGSGALEVPELAPLIRWMGYQANQYRIYSFAEEVNLEEDSSLTLEGFTLLIAKFMRASLVAVRNVFKGREVYIKDLEELLTLVGYEPTEEELEVLVDKAGGDLERMLDFGEFKRLERLHRRLVRIAMQENTGYTQADLKRYKDYFDKNAEVVQGQDGEVFLTQKSMRELLSTIFPDTQLDRERHLKIGQLVREADVDGNDLFDYQEYLWLMRKVCDIMDRDNLYAGLRLKKALGYSHDEVKQFRDLYQVSDEDMSGYIDCDELCNLFGNLVEMDFQAKKEMQERFMEVDDGDGQLDFWEFLHFMRRIQDENWRNINKVTGKKKH